MDMKPGERIRNTRKLLGLTQEGFADRLGYSRAFVAQIERGISEPSRNFLKKMAEVFGISSDHILYGNQTMDEWQIFMSRVDERIAELKEQGVIPRASVSEDEMAIIKTLRSLSMSDSIDLLRKLLLKIKIEPIDFRSPYEIEFIGRVKRIVEKGSMEWGIDYDGLLSAFEGFRRDCRKR